MRPHNLARVVLSAVALFTLIGCGGNRSAIDSGVDSSDSNATQQADLSVIHASPDCDTLDLYLNDQRSGTVDYRQASGFVKVAAGWVKVDLRLHADAQAKVVLSTRVQVDAQAKVSLALVGRLTANPTAEADARLKLVILTAAAVDNASVKLRFLNASPSAPAIDLAADANVVASAIAFATASEYTKLDADLALGAELGLRLGGATVDAAVAATVARYEKGSVITVIGFGEILPTADDDKFLAVSILDETRGTLTDLNLQINAHGPPASFYLFHGGLDLGTIDVATAEGSVLFSSLEYTRASAIVQAAAGVTHVVLRASGTTDALFSANLKLLPSTNWTIGASGLRNFGVKTASKLTLASAMRLTASIGGGTFARVFNGLANVDSIDVNAASDVWAQSLGFARAGAYIALAAFVPVNLRVQASVTVQAILSTAISPLVINACRDQVVTYFVVGSTDTAVGKPVQVVAVIESNPSPSPLSIFTL